MSRARGLVALGLTLCLVAGAFAAIPLFVPGLALLLIVAVASVWVWLAARGAAVTRTVERRTVEEGALLRLELKVARSRIPPPGGELRPGLRGPVLPIPKGSRATVTVTLRPAGRGRHRLGPAALEISDPLGLCRRSAFSADEEVLVLPRLEPVEAVEYGGRAGRWEGGGPAGLAGLGRHIEAGATEVDTLQPLRPGTPASRIHWPTVARAGALMERRLVADADLLPLVAVDPRAPASVPALDQAVRAAASLCAHLARRGGCALLFPGERAPMPLDPEMRALPHALTRLALIEPSAGGPQLGPVAGAAAVLWVTAAPHPRGLPASVSYLVSPHRQPRWPVRFSVAGCHGYSIAAPAAGASL